MAIYEYIYQKNLMYLCGASLCDIEKKTYKENAVEIETLVPNLQEFLRDRNCPGVGKVLAAKKYADAIADKSYTYPAKTQEN